MFSFVLDYLWVPYLCYVICFCALLCVCVVSRALSQGSIRNSLSTSSEVEVWTAYILPLPDPTKWEYTGFVVVVVVVKSQGLHSANSIALAFFNELRNSSY